MPDLDRETPDPTAAAEPSLAELAEACADLVRLWHTRRAIDPVRDRVNVAEADLHAVNGLASHAYRTVEVALRLLEEGLVLETAPLVRLSFECALTAHWAAQVPDGTQAILNEDYRSRASMAETMRRSGVFEAAGLAVPDPTDQSLESLSNAQARHFQALCRDLSPGGDEIYMYYRTLCWFSHPTNYVIDHYADTTATDGVLTSLTLRRTPKAREDIRYLLQHICAMSLVLSASALNYLDQHKTHEARITDLASRIGVKATLLMTDHAKARVASTSSTQPEPQGTRPGPQSRRRGTTD